MTVREAADKFGFDVLAGADELDREITGVYAGDLLSWVMSKLKEDNAWITVQGHLNAVAVANLAGAACIIIAEDAEVAEQTIAKADSVGVAILRTGLNIFEISKLFAEIF